MDRELPEEIRNEICDIVLAHPSGLGMHDLRTRQSGQIKVIQLHLSLAEAHHRVANEVEYAIMEAFPQSDVIIHRDPVGSRTECR
ncbi:hypothetical protein GF1_03870 [Desulfolithobacter dissulfuricans]|uniref:Cation efflux protein cytoplasmic domain-containing protein n=1 Tax=Desulfolithobacter dissulfuricans TaxID=2795293 RepID=A0A915TY96_9BACT|nr:cation transporter dimerization domain-containing protein [Desulfolithobacter dissulfuricans]BCO08011.1 hypothetical protein GF1_03870 [Desulfolithobacter dissulfuricans]